jgi:hypothetical protein
VTGVQTCALPISPLVAPEYPLYGLLAIVACFAAFATFKAGHYLKVNFHKG